MQGYLALKVSTAFHTPVYLIWFSGDQPLVNLLNRVAPQRQINKMETSRANSTRPLIAHSGIWADGKELAHYRGATSISATGIQTQ